MVPRTRPACVGRHTLIQYEPTTSYHVEKLEGFKLMVSRKARTSKDLKAAMDLLRLRFQEVNTKVPQPSLEVLKKIPIWVEENDTKFPCMCYHEDKGWLKENGMNPDKARGVELANLKSFVSWSFDQPLMVLHEYAHGFHHAKYGFDGKFVLNAYQNAMDQHLYDSVQRVRGPLQKAYATTNQMEYFAELSEALFGYNDFFPFTRPELKEHDPVGFKMVSEAWGVKD